ncbi:hypothetical protein [Massilia sp. erpn]|uniref:hypothetical protein n=1 Tax=Massilia sp. erpn TaxID=2738142 RepID=UPI002106A633|nr:hypothetical protein [Massilia sp. erpn]UTY57679.1 hypothetical protein HPQ68_11090 [Massilia sp. erpn]
MTFRDEDILHQGLRRFWISYCLDSSGVSITWANMLRHALMHLSSAKSLADVLREAPGMNVVAPVPGKRWRYYMPLNSWWRLTFKVDRAGHGVVSELSIESTRR